MVAKPNCGLLSPPNNIGGFCVDILSGSVGSPLSPLKRLLEKRDCIFYSFDVDALPSYSVSYNFYWNGFAIGWLNGLFCMVKGTLLKSLFT